MLAAAAAATTTAAADAGRQGGRRRRCRRCPSTPCPPCRLSRSRCQARRFGRWGPALSGSLACRGSTYMAGATEGQSCFAETWRNQRRERSGGQGASGPRAREHRPPSASLSFTFNPAVITCPADHSGPIINDLELHIARAAWNARLSNARVTKPLELHFRRLFFRFLGDPSSAAV